MILNKRERLINELCKKGDLEAYREIIGLLIDQIEQEGAKVSAKYNELPSNIDPSLERPYHIRISMVHVKKPLNIIWNMRHEFGHYLDWPPKAEDMTVDREITAWRIAEEILQQYPRLQEHTEYFRFHKRWCLETYFRKYGYPENWSWD